MAKLTKRTIDALQPTAKDYVVFDDDLPGFGVRVLPSGRKSFLVQYRSGGRSRRVTLGRFGTITADDGRKMALQTLGVVVRGQNPAGDVKEYRGSPTVSTVCDRFLREHVTGRLKLTTQKDYQRCIERFIRPVLGTFKIIDITRADVSQLHYNCQNPGRSTLPGVRCHTSRHFQFSRTARCQR